MRTIAFFAHDSTESTVTKRATAFLAHGARVLGFMFRRQEREERVLAWENIPLGVTSDRNYLARLPRLFAGLFKALSHAQRLQACDVIYARNIDMLLIAVLAKLTSRSRGIIVYEVLDIHGFFLGRHPLNRLFRWCERRLMTACSLVVVSAPDHVTHYLQAIQGYRGLCFLLENKLSAHGFPERDALAETLPPGPPWVIGMFGVLRCTRSLEILTEVAQRLPDKAAVYLRGVTSESDLSTAELADLQARLPNVVYGGPYTSPRDLPDIYGKVHFIWALDFKAVGGNSDWCLANRIYEGGAMGTVLLAEQGNATGRMVEREGLGFTLTPPFADSLVALIERMTPAQYKAAARRVASVKRSVFVDENDTARLLKTLDRLCEARCGHTPSGVLNEASDGISGHDAA